MIITESKDFNVEPGIYDAICYGIIDIGTQHNEWQGETSVKHQAILKFELMDEIMEYEGKQVRKIFSQFYTLSLHVKAKLRKHLNGWRGRDFTAEELSGFELKNVLGKPCRLVVGLTENGKSTIESVSKYKGDKADIDRDIEYFSFEDFRGDFPEWMSDGIKGLCQKSDEYHEAFAGAVSGEISNIAPETVDDGSENLPF